MSLWPPGAPPFSCHLTLVWHLVGGRTLDGWNLSKRNPFILFQSFYLKKKHLVFFALGIALVVVFIAFT